MAFWEAFWNVVLYAGIGAFFVLAVVVTIGGVGDMRALFRGIQSQHDDAGDGEEPSDSV